MTVQRSERVKEQLKKEIGYIIQNNIKDPRLGMVTVTEAEVSADLRNAKVFISVYGSEEEKKQTMKILTKANGFIRSEIGKRIRMKHVPELLIKFDETIEKSNRIQELLHQIEAEKHE